MPQHDNPTKLELFLRAHTYHSCECGGGSIIHIAQVCFLKCEKCGAPLTRGFTLDEVKVVQDDLICP